MSDIPYGFEKPIAKRLRDTVRGSGLSIGPDDGIPEQRRVAICLTPSGGIPARSGTTPGTATVTLCMIDGTNGIVTTSVTETAYNIGGTSVAGSIYTPLEREYIGGEWIVVDDKPSSCTEAPITDIRVNGNTLQYKQCGSWVTWHTGTDCP